jgi:hypothetical protein
MADPIFEQFMDPDSRCLEIDGNDDGFRVSIYRPGAFGTSYRVVLDDGDTERLLLAAAAHLHRRRGGNGG